MAKIINILATIIVVVIFLQMVPSIIKSVKNTYEDAFELKTKVGVIKIDGAICDTSPYIKNIKEHFECSDIKAILVHIECPGGTSGSCQAIYNEILIHKKENPKPIVVLTNDICASGGYYIACACDYIIASPMSLVGSVGSYIGCFKVKEFMESHKLQYSIKQSGKYKTALNPFTEDSPEVSSLVQSVTDDVYKQFVSDVAAKRKLSVANADKWANGKFFTGKQALELGLIDETGSESNAIKKIKELAMIEKDKEIQWVKASKENKYAKLLGIEDNEQISVIDEIIEKVCIKLGFKENQIMLK